MNVTVELTQKQVEIVLAVLTDRIRTLELDNYILKSNEEKLRERLAEASKKEE